MSTIRKCGDDFPRPIRQLETVKIGRFCVVRNEIESLDGLVYPYSYLQEAACVCVLPVIGNDIILIRQYRYPVSDWCLEFPCGAVELAETPEEAAKRELLEETGCRANQIVPLGYCYARAGVSNCVVHFFLAVCSEFEQQHPDPTEAIRVLTVPSKVFDGWIEKGSFSQLMGISCWLRAKYFHLNCGGPL